LDLSAVDDLAGDFHFDRARSQAEQDFRIFIRPAFWSSQREFCLEHIVRDDDPTLETSPPSITDPSLRRLTLDKSDELSDSA
jgi:hypothetical protein